MRLLCCLLMLCSVLLSGCGGSKESKEDAKANAVAAIKKLGGKVQINGFQAGEPVVKVVLYQQPVTDAGLEHLKGMTSLQILDLRSTKVTDAGLVVDAG